MVYGSKDYSALRMATHYQDNVIDYYCMKIKDEIGYVISSLDPNNYENMLMQRLDLVQNYVDVVCNLGKGIYQDMLIREIQNKKDIDALVELQQKIQMKLKMKEPK